MNETVLKLIYNVGILFVMMIPGVIMKKCNLSADGFGKGLSNLVLYIAQPALVFLAYVRPYDSSVLMGIIWVLILSIIAHTIFSVVAMLFFKKAPDSARRMLRFVTIFANAAFMGMPLIASVLGDEALIYASIYNITFNLFLWSLGVHICTANRDHTGDGEIDRRDAEITKKKKSEVSLSKVFLHPVTLAAVLGLIFFFLPIDSYIPDLVTESLSMLKALVAPLSMVVLGLRLAEIDLRGFFSDLNVYIFLALRHFALPLIVLGVMKLLIFLGVGITDDVVICILIMTAAPAATSATMFAEKYDCDAAYVSKLVAVSTLFCIISMPLLIMLV